MEGGAVLARSDVQGLFLLNPAAWQIWLRFRERASAQDTAAYLAAAFGISYERALQDVYATLADWQKNLLAAPAHAVGTFDSGFPPDAAGISLAIDCRLHHRSFRVLLSSRDLADEIAPRLESLRVPAAKSFGAHEK